MDVIRIRNNYYVLKGNEAIIIQHRMNKMSGWLRHYFVERRFYPVFTRRSYSPP